MVVLENLLIVLLTVVARDSLSKFLTELRMVFLKKCCVLSDYRFFAGPDSRLSSSTRRLRPHRLR